MKKILESILIFTVILSLLVSGISCSKSPPAPTAAPAPAPAPLPTQVDYMSPTITGKDWNNMTLSQKEAWVDTALDAMMIGGELEESERQTAIYYIEKLDEVFYNPVNERELVAWELTAFTESTKEELKQTLPPMKTFTSEYFGVSIDYPESWRAKEENRPYEIFLSDPARIVQMTVSTIDQEFQQRHKVFTPEDAVNWYLGLVDASDCKLLSKPTTTTIQGYPACSVTYIKSSSGSWYKYFSIKKGNLLYSVRGLTQDPLYRPEIDAMLDSFRFTND